MHCLEDKLRPSSITELSCNLVMIEGHPVWSDRAKHAYGHLLFTDIEEGIYQIEQLQITNPEVIPHGMRCEGLLRVLSWVSFDLPDHYKRTLSMLLKRQLAKGVAVYTRSQLKVGTSEMKLTLCQVTTDEVDAAAKLLDKACQKLRGIPDVPSQRISDLEAAIRQMRQLSCISSEELNAMKMLQSTIA